jgi:RNA polymerase sigma factor (sigma-70 family)
MENVTWAALRDLLADRYDEFRRRLTRRLGSEELACESLNETWLRLYRQDEIGPVHNPSAYLLRVASNIGTDRRRAERRNVRRADALSVLEVADPAPDPGRIVEGRLMLEALNRAINALPPRTREILTAARIGGLSQQEIADRFGISTRMVRIELRRALDKCEMFVSETKFKQQDFLSEQRQSSLNSDSGASSRGPKKKNGIG